MASAAIVLLCMTVWCCAGGSTVRWTALVGGSWSQQDNWEGGKVPGPDDNVVIELIERSALLDVRLQEVVSGDSSICRAAIHDGRIPATGGVVTVYKLPGQSSYQASTQNGITTGRLLT
ncbi:hypothetical protein Bbelb_100830 [Branchiostoma belcheri]|nr:hypothetical protein Bbelb_100830 [Branchiostoma belcheri]